MSKSRNRKWYDNLDEDYDYKAKKRGDDRRSAKKRKNALKQKNMTYLNEDYEQD
jgi:hypothetical protein